MSIKSTTWEFNANTSEELVKVRQSWPSGAKRTVAEELFQLAWLLESLARIDLLKYPFKARHTGEKGVPDFQLESGSRGIAVEMAKVTTANLEHARSLQMKIADPPSHFTAMDLCEPEAFARKLKADRDGWYKFVASRLSPECRTWLSAWNSRDKVPENVKALFVAALNSIIDGPPIVGNPSLARAFPPAEVFTFEGLASEETARHRKAWLDQAFWEEWATAVNPTLMVTPFVRDDDSKMSRKEVLETAFLVPAMAFPGPTLEEEHQIWLDKVFLEVHDKSQKLAGQDFRHGDEDWLVLWDRLGTRDWQLEARAQAVAIRLDARWRPGWFSRVFLQDEYFEWQLMFSPNNTVAFPRAHGGAARSDPPTLPNT